MSNPLNTKHFWSKVRQGVKYSKATPFSRAECEYVLKLAEALTHTQPNGPIEAAIERWSSLPAPDRHAAREGTR